MRYQQTKTCGRMQIVTKEEEEDEVEPITTY